MRILLATCVSAGLYGDALPHDVLPHIDGDTLTGKHLALPDAAKGHPALLVIGFTHGSRTQTKAWADRAQHELGDRLAVWSVVVLQDAPKLVRGMAVHGVKSGTPPERRDNTLLIYHYEKELKLAVGFDRPDDAYLLLLDAGGDVKWKFHGAVTDTAIKEVRDLTAEEHK
jgi:hypothetical protein